MTLENCYRQIGSDYQQALVRMANSEKMLLKFVKKFPNDPSAAALFDSFEKEDFQTAFRMAHTMKGLCANLGLDRLRESSSELTEALRGGVSENAGELLERVRRDYEMTINALSELDE